MPSSAAVLLAHGQASMPCRATSPGGSATLLPLGALLLGMVLPGTAGAQSSASPPSQPTPTLPTVEVKATADTEPGGYQATTTRIGKLKQLPKDVPQALTIVTQGLMKDKNADTLKEAMSQVAGLTFNAGEGGRIGDNMNLRGFYSFGDLYLDGIRDVAQYNRETFNLEQVDVLRGSGSMLFGRGQAGGVINQVSKEASLLDKSQVSVTVGTEQHARITADINKVLGEQTALRINAMATDTGSTRDHVDSKRGGLAANLRLGIHSPHEFSLSWYQLKTRNVPDFGVPFFQNKPLDVPGSRFYGTTRDYEDNDTRMATASYKARLSPTTELKTVLRAAHYTRDLWVAQPQLRLPTCAAGVVTSVSDAHCINRSIKARGGEERTLTSQTDLSTQFNTGSMRHEALLGVEILREDASRWSYSTAGLTIPSTTVGAPDASAPGLSSGYGHRNRSAINSYVGHSHAIYAQDTIQVGPHWKVLLGLRQDTLRATYTGPGTRNTLRFSELSYRSGLIWQPKDNQTYYLAWNDSFNPTADLYQLDNGMAFPAERSQTTELGAKWDLFDGDLSLRAALYRAEKQWERNTDIESNGGILSKRRRTTGLELEAAGRITPRLEIFGGIAVMDAAITEPGYTINTVTGVRTQHNPNLRGMRPRNAPRYTANLWATYRLDGGWRVGLGADWKGERLAYGINTATTAITPNVAPAYVRWDAMVAYEQARYGLRLNVTNLFNKRTYQSIYENGGHVVPGSQRGVQLSADLRF